ncbi:MAG TPA: hypothetical protein VN428_04550 [Bryobacteraceae bacterium]|nr:hypothetical protein [Bryobacteraceae bacterium]
MRDAVFCLLGLLRCREHIQPILEVLPEPRREALNREFEQVAGLSRDQAVERLNGLSAAADRELRERMLGRWGGGFASEPRVIQKWLAARAAGMPR